MHIKQAITCYDIVSHLREGARMPASLQPTKEQVRAYMQQRQREFCRRPPPVPEEIRRQLGWHCSASQAEYFPTSTLFLPGTIAQLAALMAVEWCFLAAGAGRSS
ncbi:MULTISPECIES: hypothetical protein [unclassified Duganella]|uniref:hypothetical protein n=1 Tax=unclassified Duganella TaxID=2636909 RepID=UPI001E4574A3|nr:MULTISPECIES: hypothetical protein [unclassified Duganella]